MNPSSFNFYSLSSTSTLFPMEDECSTENSTVSEKQLLKQMDSIVKDSSKTAYQKHFNIAEELIKLFSEDNSLKDYLIKQSPIRLLDRDDTLCLYVKDPSGSDSNQLTPFSFFQVQYEQSIDLKDVLLPPSIRYRINGITLMDWIQYHLEQSITETQKVLPPHLKKGLQPIITSKQLEHPNKVRFGMISTLLPLNEKQEAFFTPGINILKGEVYMVLAWSSDGKLFVNSILTTPEPDENDSTAFSENNINYFINLIEQREGWKIRANHLDDLNVFLIKFRPAPLKYGIERISDNKRYPIYSFDPEGAILLHFKPLPLVLNVDHEIIKNIKQKHEELKNTLNIEPNIIFSQSLQDIFPSTESSEFIQDFMWKLQHEFQDKITSNFKIKNSSNITCLDSTNLFDLSHPSFYHIGEKIICMTDYQGYEIPAKLKPNLYEEAKNTTWKVNKHDEKFKKYTDQPYPYIVMFGLNEDDSENKKYVCICEYDRKETELESAQTPGRFARSIVVSGQDHYYYYNVYKCDIEHPVLQNSFNTNFHQLSEALKNAVSIEQKEIIQQKNILLDDSQKETVYRLFSLLNISVFDPYNLLFYNQVIYLDFTKLFEMRSSYYYFNKKLIVRYDKQGKEIPAQLDGLASKSFYLDKTKNLTYPYFIRSVPQQENKFYIYEYQKDGYVKYILDKHHPVLEESTIIPLNKLATEFIPLMLKEELFPI